MITSDSKAGIVYNLLADNTIVTIKDIRNVLGKCTRMTIFRVLLQLDYLSSYSHRGAYYSLAELADFDGHGLWAFNNVRFSRHGNLGQTINKLVQESDAGFTIAELDELLGVETKHASLNLYRNEKIDRERIGNRLVCLSKETAIQRQQKLWREDREVSAAIGMGIDVEVLPEEAKAAIILFFSLLNEKQRRLYAGLEAAKIGYGGDRKVADLLGLDPHTVAKGRNELLGGAIDEAIRKTGGGNRAIEKKHQP